MIANFFSKTKPVNVVNLVVLLFIYYLITLFFINLSGFSAILIVKNLGFFLWHIIFLVFVNFIVTKNNLTQDNLYTLLLVVLLYGTFPQAMFNQTIIYTNIILLLCYRKIYSLKSGLNIASKLFDAGFWVGVATIIYPLSIVAIFLIYTAIFIYQKLSFKNLFIPVIGVVTPIFLFFTYHFYFDSLPVFYKVLDFNYNFNFDVYNQLKFLIPITFLITILLWCVVVATPKIVLVSNSLKLSWNMLINNTIIAIIIVLLSPVKDGSEFLFLIFPASIIITNFLQKSESSNFKNLILYLFLLISISVYVLQFLSVS